MKKRLIQLALILGLMTLTCVAAQAAETDEPTSGFRIPTDEGVVDAYKDDVTLTPLDADDKEVTGTDNNVRFPGAVKMKVTYKKAALNSEYLLCVLEDDGSATATPTADNMAYINQQTADGANVEFTAFPKKQEATSVKYTVYLSSNADAASGGISSFTKVATFEYYGQSAVMLGDVDGDRDIDVQDALYALYLSVGTVNYQGRPEAEQRQAADLNGNGAVQVDEALNILYCSVGTKTGVKALDDYIDNK